MHRAASRTETAPQVETRRTTDESKTSGTIRVSPEIAFYSLIGIIALLVMLDVSVKLCDDRIVCGAYTSFSRNYGTSFDLSTESNIPTWFSVIQLAATALALFISSALHKEQRGSRLSWIMLGVIFLYLSLDEATDLHGLWIKLVPEDMSLTGERSSFDWVLPGIIIVSATGLMFLPWLRSLPRKTVVLFLLAATTYVAGGLGLELIGAFTYVAEPGASNVLYVLVATVEEALEMFGVAIMFFAVLDTWRGSRFVLTSGC